MARLLLAIPCFNEGRAIGPLLEEIARVDEKYEPLVIDDASTDDTFEQAASRARCLKLAINLGIGGAVQSGVRFALENGYDFVVQIDGDGQHPPGEIRRLLDAYRAAPANIIIGSRFLGTGQFRSSALRRVGIAMLCKAIRWLYGARITDPTSGFRLLDRAAIRLFADRYPHDYPEPISAAWALQSGLTVREVPVAMRSRNQGVSSIRGLKTVSYMLRVLGYLVLSRFGRRV